MEWFIEDWCEDESTDAIPSKYVLTIGYGEPGDSDEVAVMVHRGDDPSSAGAARKLKAAVKIVAALNDAGVKPW